MCKPWSNIIWIALPIALLCTACPDEAGQTKKDAGPAQFAEIQITSKADHFLYTYLLADGSFATTDKMDQIPKEARGQVIVVDTKLSPAKRKSSQVLYVADLTSSRDDGTFSYSLVSRFRFERDLLRDPSASSGVLPPECENIPPTPTDRVMVYSTDWCGVCKTAMKFMKKEGIPFQEKDVEKDPGAQRELTCKALKSQTRINGVPVFDVAGTLMLGFDRDSLIQAASRLSPAPKEPAKDLR